MPIEMERTEGTSNLVEVRWHALYTRHQHEKLVAHALTGKGFDIFLPLYRTVHRWKDRWKELELPLFPNYLFILGGLDRMLNILTTPGVHSLVAWGGRPADIPQNEIDAVRRLVESPLRIQQHPFIKCGDRVRIKSGPLEGIEGILVRSKSAYRLVLSVEMLARSAAVEVDVSMVERIGGPEPFRRDASRIDTRIPVVGPYGPSEA